MFSKQGNIMNVKRTKMVNKNASLAVRSQFTSIFLRLTNYLFQDAQAKKEDEAWQAKQ